MTHNKAVVIVLLGPPGSGKGETAKMLQDLGFAVIETGKALRTLGEIDREIGESLDRGELQPDSVVIPAERQRLQELSSIERQRIVFDGFPRTSDQAAALLNEFVAEDAVICVLDLHASLEVVTERLLIRGRTDDTPTGIEKRHRAYMANHDSIVEYFKLVPTRAHVLTVNAESSKDVVHATILAHLNQLTQLNELRQTIETGLSSIEQQATASSTS